MNGLIKSFTLFLICIISQVTFADSVYSQFVHPDVVSRKSLGQYGSMAIHVFGEHQVVEIFLRSETVAMSVHEIRKRETADSAYKGIIRPETLVVVSGGFFGYNHSGDETPIGLVRQGGKKKVALIEWSYGGVLVSDRVGNVKIIPANNSSQAGGWSEAIQSKPIIVFKGKVDVRKNLHDAPFNRVAIGNTYAGDILIVGVFHEFGEAATILDFAQIYKKIADTRGLKILRALAMDGGTGAQISIPSENVSFGDTGLSYFPNAVRFDRKPESEAAQ